jgi:hypothetical protein
MKKQQEAPQVSNITVEDLRKSHVKAAFFADGARGYAMQVKVCIEYPRLRVVWTKESFNHKGKSYYVVDDRPFETLDEAAQALNGPVTFIGNDEGKQAYHAANLVLPKVKKSPKAALNRGRPSMQLDMFRDSAHFPIDEDIPRKKSKKKSVSRETGETT